MDRLRPLEALLDVAHASAHVAPALLLSFPLHRDNDNKVLHLQAKLSDSPSFERARHRRRRRPVRRPAHHTSGEPAASCWCVDDASSLAVARKAHAVPTSC